MVLDKDKAFKLLKALNAHCRQKHIVLHRGKISLAKIIMDRYKYVVLMKDDGTKYLCNNPKHLKKFAMQENVKKANPLITPHCDLFAKYNTL